MHKLAEQIAVANETPSRDAGLSLIHKMLCLRDLPAFHWHPLGFAHGDVFKLDAVALRIHLWPTCQRHQQEPFFPLHTHAFHLASTVLSGTILNCTRRVTKTQSGEEQLYRVSYRLGGSALDSTGEFCRVTPESELVYDAGDTYEVPIETFHTSFVREDCLAATLVVARTVRDESPSVVGPRLGASQYYYERVRCDPRLIRATLESVSRTG